MEEIFSRQICSVCKNYNNCNKNKFKYKIDKNINIYFCTYYKKDPKKIIPYKKPLFVTAKRDYVRNIEL